MGKQTAAEQTLIDAPVSKIIDYLRIKLLSFLLHSSQQSSHFKDLNLRRVLQYLYYYFS